MLDYLNHHPQYWGSLLILHFFSLFFLVDGLVCKLYLSLLFVVSSVILFWFGYIKKKQQTSAIKYCEKNTTVHVEVYPYPPALYPSQITLLDCIKTNFFLCLCLFCLNSKGSCFVNVSPIKIWYQWSNIIYFLPYPSTFFSKTKWVMFFWILPLGESLIPW